MSSSLNGGNQNLLKPVRIPNADRDLRDYKMDTVHKESAEPCWAAEGIFSNCVTKHGKVIVYLSDKQETWFLRRFLKKPGGEGVYIIYIRQDADKRRAGTPFLPASDEKMKKLPI